LIILAGTIIADDYDLAQFFPGVDNVIGRELTIVLTAVEFDRAAAETYVVENLLPSDASRSDQVVAQSTNRRGPSPDLRTRIEERMATDIENDAITVEALRGMKQEALAARYDTKRYTAVQARKNVLGKTPSR